MFQDEAGFGRINKPKACWCKKGIILNSNKTIDKYNQIWYNSVGDENEKTYDNRGRIQLGERN